MGKGKVTKAERRRAEKAARKLLRSRHFFRRFLDAVRRMGLVGEQRNALVVFIVIVSRFWKRPMNLFVRGHSSAGKNWLVTRVLKLIPKSAVAEITSASEKSWSYSRSAFRHRVVYVHEQNEAAGTMDPIRLLISEGRLIRRVTAFEGGRPVNRKIVARGPVAAISTTTKNRLQTDDETRHISIWLDESPQQSREIVKAYTHQPKLSRDELKSWQAIHRFLEKRSRE